VSGRFINISGTVTIAAGTTLIFGSGGGFQVASSGRLLADGTPGNEVILTAEEPIPGYWRGVRYADSNSTHNALRHTVIEYGGSERWGVRRGGPANLTIDGARLELDTVSLQHGASYGIWIRNFEALTMTGASFVTGNGSAPVRTIPNAVASLSPDTSYTGNAEDVIEVRDGRVSHDAVWPNLNVPLLLTSSIDVRGAHLEIGAANELVFRQNAGLQVQSSASLAIEDAPQLPVVMRGEEAIAGLWRGIRFAGSNSRNNRLRYLVIRDGGSERWGVRRGGARQPDDRRRQG
jgi:hypothetical protein